MRKSFWKGLLVGVLITTVLMLGVSGFADSILKSIQVAENSVTIKVNGNALSAPNFVYDGRTYIQVKAISDALGKDLGWDATSNTVSINDKGVSSSVLPDKDIKDSGKVTQPNSTNDSNNTQQPTNTSYVFRKVNWGMSKDEVIKSESNKPNIDEGQYISYITIIDNKDCIVLYVLNDDYKLCGIMVTLNKTHTNSNDYIDDFNSFKKMLTNKYGNPTRDDVLWKNDLFKDSPQSYGTAVAAGHLVYMTTWNLDESTIVNFLNGDNFKVKLTIMIKSTKYPQPTENIGI